MPCSDSSSSMVIRLDPEERFVSFEYAKITCGREIDGGTGLSDYLKGYDLTQILELSYARIAGDLQVEAQEDQFILYLEWDVLRSAVALYLGVDDPHIDTERCMITSIETDETGTEIAQVVLPPKEMPKILPCNLAEQDNQLN